MPQDSIHPVICQSEQEPTVVVLQHTPGQGLYLRARLPPRALKTIKVTALTIAGLIGAYLAGS